MKENTLKTFRLERDLFPEVIPSFRWKHIRIFNHLKRRTLVTFCLTTNFLPLRHLKCLPEEQTGVWLIWLAPSGFSNTGYRQKTCISSAFESRFNNYLGMESILEWMDVWESASLSLIFMIIPNGVNYTNCKFKLIYRSSNNIWML